MTQTIRVSSASELQSALATAQGGETILLASGNYGSVSLRDTASLDLSFASEVTIASEDPGNPAVFDTLYLKGASNLTFDGITFDYTYAPSDELYSRPFEITGVDNLTIRNSSFDGDLAQGRSALDDGLGFAIGLSVRNADGVTLENNTFNEFYRGMVIQTVDNIVVDGNEMYGIRMDGMNYGEATNAQIINNHLHDFTGSSNPGDHRDMIQFWTNGTTTASTDILIANNTLDIGDGDYTQSIFMRNDQVDQGLAGYELYYKNVTIQDNLIINGHMHGVTVGETDGLTIQNNTIVHSDGGTVDGQDGGVEIPTIRVASASQNVTIDSNITNTITGHNSQSDWTVTNNVLVQDQDPTSANYYNDVFYMSSMDGALDGTSYMGLPGSQVQTSGAGVTQSATALAQATQFHAVADANDPSYFQFTADLTGSLPAGTQYTWLLSDGTTGTGQTLTHQFQTGGTYDAQLIVTLPDGTQITEDAAIQAPDLVILSMQPDASFVATEYGTFDTVAAQSAASGTGMALGGSGPVAQVSREHVQDILVQDSFEISMDLSGTSGGDLFRIHSSMIAKVQGNGSLQFTAYSTDGSVVRVSTSGVDLTDGTSHSLRITYANDQLELWVDDALSGSAAMAEPVAATGTHDLVFGNPWSGTNFTGTLQSFDIALVPGATQGGSNPGSFTPPTTGTPTPITTPVVTPVDTTTVEGVSDTPETAQAPDSISGVLPETDPAPATPTPVVVVAPETPPEAPAETPAVETPVVETPVVETPVVETPVVEEPVVETPAVETPVVETPAAPAVVVAEPTVATPDVSETPASTGTILSLMDDGTFLAEDAGFGVVVNADAIDGIELPSRGTAITVDREHVEDVLGNEAFEISLSITADDTNGPRLGDVFRMQGSLIVQVRGNGDLLVRAFGEEGGISRIATKGLDMYDGASHDLTLRFEDGLLQVWADGAMVGDAELSGPLADSGNHDLTFGNPWRGHNFNGRIEAFEVSTDPSPIQTDGTLQQIDDTFEQLYAVTSDMMDGTVIWGDPVTPEDADDAVEIAAASANDYVAPQLMEHPLDL